MITIKLMGGLGNQMFQYAAARGLADINNTDVLLDLSWFNQEFDVNTTAREYELNCFKLDNISSKFTGSFSQRVAHKFAKKYREPHYHYDSSVRHLPKNTELFGYFQSEKYFLHSRDRLLTDFTWAKPAMGKNTKLLNKISADVSSVSIHVRRGDYITNDAAAKFHGTANVKYYLAAVSKLATQVKAPHLYIFSDEPDWCSRHLKFSYPTEYISHNTVGSEDMRLMVHCRHNIIANSSFSWWGAWLNQNPKKVVIAPKVWFAHKESNTNDVVPKSWQRI